MVLESGGGTVVRRPQVAAVAQSAKPAEPKVVELQAKLSAEMQAKGVPVQEQQRVLSELSNTNSPLYKAYIDFYNTDPSTPEGQEALAQIGTEVQKLLPNQSGAFASAFAETMQSEILNQLPATLDPSRKELVARLLTSTLSLNPDAARLVQTRVQAILAAPPDGTPADPQPDSSLLLNYLRDYGLSLRASHGIQA